MSKAIWCDKYRPQSIDDCILPLKTKRELNKFIRSEEDIPNLLFVGPPGIAKTTSARAIMRQTNTEHIVVNASLDGNIDTIRTKVIQFASTVSWTGKRKFVIFEEVDKMTVAAQAALRVFIEEFGSGCGFIFIGNNVNAMDGAIISRLERVTFEFEASEKGKLAQQLFKRIKMILDKEKIEYEDNDIKHLLMSYLKYSNDIRQLLIRLQKYCVEGKLEIDLAVVSNARFEPLIDALKKRDVTKIRQWAGQNSDIDAQMVFNFLYENSDAICKGPAGVAALIAHVAEHMYQHSFVANPEINIAACLLDIASDCV